MAELFNTILKQLGAFGLIGLTILIGVVWLVAHTQAQKCERVSLLFGLVDYTKSGNCRNDTSANSGTIVDTIVSAGPIQVQLMPNQETRVPLSCPKRSSDRALGVDFVADQPLTFSVLKDSI